jgi:hypothetical protein
MTPARPSPAAWTARELRDDPGWIFEFDAGARRDLAAAAKRIADAPPLSLTRADVDLRAAGPVLAAAMRQVRDGRGIALLRGLPRAELDEHGFAALTWALGLHTGVARPQNRASEYLAPVRDAGSVYRSAGGRGYSSNAELDFHTDSADVVMLACYNQAREGGLSMVTSSVAAHAALQAEAPALAAELHRPFWFSRQTEQAPDEGPAYPNPVFDAADGLLCSKWNRNRIQTAQRLDGVPQLTAAQRAAMDALDAVLRRPGLMFDMYLQPGDVQILNSHVTLHSRTEFVDHDEPGRKRLLFRLWLATPDSPSLPESWLPAYRSVAPGTVRGGIVGQAYDETRRTYERRQAAALGMPGFSLVSPSRRGGVLHRPARAQYKSRW